VYKDNNGEWRCVHDRVVFNAGPDNPCNDCEYEDYMESWDSWEVDDV
jgi:hypothetical protein